MSTRRRLDQQGGPGGGGGPGAKQVARNKRGTPVYSHEDIREQYCINEKELHALEASRRKPIFGCLTSSGIQPSPCRRKSLIPACLRSKVQSDENIYGRTPPLPSTSPPHKKHQTIDYEDESYFKRRPKTICYTDPKKLASLDDSLVAKLNNSAKESDDGTRRPSQLAIGSSEYHSAEILQPANTRSNTITVNQRSAYTQPNTPNLPHSARVRTAGSADANLDEKERPKHVSFQQKSVSHSATLDDLDGVSDPAPLNRPDSPKESIKSTESKNHERLLDGPRSPEYYEQKALDQLLAPVLTKALMQEKMKRSCMRTQATQTDAALVRKSLPHLALSPRSDKTEMVSQAAQTNGVDGRRRLVKSLSEAARYEGMDFEIYDLDGLPTPPPPPTKSIPQVLPLYPKEHSVWDFHPYSHSLRLLHNNESPESIKSEVIHRCKCYFGSDSAEDVFVCSPARPRKPLMKTMSDGEILLDKRKALSLATGYMEVDINGHSNQEAIIKPQCVDERSYDLSNNRIFSQESLGEDTDEDVFHEHYLCSDISTQSSERRLSFPSESEGKEYSSPEIPKEKNKTYNEIGGKEPFKMDVQQSKVDESPPSDYAPTEEISPVEASCMTDISSAHETGDHLEESVSESQVTVLQKISVQSGNSPHMASDSENGSFQLTDPSSTATTPSTKHKTTMIGETFDENLEDSHNTFLFAAIGASNSNLSCSSDEQTSISENAISDSSQIVVSKTSENKETKTSSAKFIYCNTSYIRERDEVIEKMAPNFYDGDLVANVKARLCDVRKLVSPESDSSSSHFTEQETSRSPASVGTNTITSKSDLSRTDSHPNTDHSETSEDYVTATDNSTEPLETRRCLLTDDRRVSSPPRLDYILEDETLTPRFVSPGSADTASSLNEGHEISDASSLGVGPTSDFDTAQDLTSPDGDTTTSASYQIEVEEGGSIISQLDNFMSSPNTFSPPKLYKVRKDVKELDNLDADHDDSLKRKSQSDASKDKKLDQNSRNKQEMHQQEPKTGAIKKRHSGEKIPKDDSRRYSKYMEEELAQELLRRRRSLTDEEREKLKSGMKLDFPPGVTMYGENLEWDEEELLEDKKTNKVDEIKSQKSITITSGSSDAFTSELLQEKQRKDKGSEGRTWNEKIKRQTDEVSTPGMVRSPAMHEGFRLEDWTPIRTPSTPDAFLALDTSDDSCDEEKIRTKSTKPDKIVRERTRTPICMMEDKTHQKVKDYGYVPYDRKRETYDKVLTNLENIDKYRNLYSSSFEKLQSSPKSEKMIVDHAVTEVSQPPYRSSIVYPGEVRRRSGDLSVGFWSQNSKERLRADDHLLDPGDNLRKADSLRSFSPGSDNVFLSGSNEQLGGSRSHLCLQCGERNLSREDILKSSPSHHLTFDRRNQERDLRNRTLSHRARSEERTALVKEWHMSAVSLELGDTPIRNGDDDDERGVYTEAYCSCPWLYVSPNDELLAWRRDALPPPFIPPHVRIPGFSYLESLETDFEGLDEDEDDLMKRGRMSPDSTCSERDFHTRYQAITHRMVHRKSSVEMYRRLLCGTFRPPEVAALMWPKGMGVPRNQWAVLSRTLVPGRVTQDREATGECMVASVTLLKVCIWRALHGPMPQCLGVKTKEGIAQAAELETDKTVYVMRGSGEFGFRIHGSKPVVVSAIETATPAETSGLEVGDIVMSINDINVLDASHSDVVRLAHSGSDTLRLDVARTCDVLTPLVTSDPTPVCAGYLYKLGGAHHAPGSNTITRKWRRRWFALKKDHCLYYYKSEVDQTPLGAVHLLDYSVHALVNGGRPYAFTVAKFGGTTLTLAARTEDARNRWGQVITQAAFEAAQRDELMEESARRVQQSPGAIATPDCFGFLYKLGMRWHQWKRRYCVLKDACLYFYHDTDATSAIGVVHLHGYRVQSTSIAGKKFAFELIPPDVKFRHFYLSTESDNDKKRWLAGLEYSIDRWIKVG